MTSESQPPGEAKTSMVSPPPGEADRKPEGIRSPADLLSIGLSKPAPGSQPSRPLSPEELQNSISGFTIHSLLGTGGMGTVYRATQQSLDRDVALKVLPVELAENPEFRARFEQEAKAMANLSHPNIVRVFSSGRSDTGVIYFVMELIEGTNLQQIIQAKSATPEDSLKWAAQVCSALHYAHGKNLIHRDIKPANILIDSSGDVRIADFGIAKLIYPESSTDRNRLDQTVTGISMGTAVYMSPEQQEGCPDIDHRSDIYSLGVVLYELLTGSFPRGFCSHPSKKLNLDQRIDQIISSAMASRPEHRYHDASEMGKALQVVYSSTRGRELTPKVDPDPNQPIGSGRKKMAIIVVSTLIILAIAFACRALIN